MIAISKPDIVVAGEGPLADFRQGLTGERAMELLQEAQGRLLIQLPVGVGKSRWLVKIIEHALDAGFFDLVIVLAPRRDILDELRDGLGSERETLILKPRPRDKCGDLDDDWRAFEAAGCGLLGRQKLCGGCPLLKKCHWPRQYGKGLKNARLILATQQHLANNPQFISHLAQQAGAKRVLTLVDESNLLIRAAERMISAQDVGRFIEVLKLLPKDAKSSAKSTERWLEFAGLFASASMVDLRDGNWRAPRVFPGWATQVQDCGWKLFGPGFLFLGFELQHFGRSDITSRERLDNGNVRFCTLPYLGSQFVIFSGSIAPDLARYRLDPDFKNPSLVSPFERYRFEHPETRWFNLNNSAGTANYFIANAARLMDFFAAKIAHNLRVGKRTLLVSRKRFAPRCQELLLERLRKLGFAQASVMTGDWDNHDLENPLTIPLITYGISGVNRFEDFDAAYCLNAYYVPAGAIARSVQEFEANEERYPVQIAMGGRPARRVARMQMPDSRQSIAPWLADAMLIQKEADVIVQAVGRVRPFTRPREIITLHAGELPGVVYSREFLSLKEARSHFGIVTPAEAARGSRADRVRELRAEGRSRREIARLLRISLATVKRDLRMRGAHFL